ncbi:MAG: DUF3500 domain-containing protein [Planctomycetales bacterium]|nr:DUF3500 domain-containing protein [Planctomycetales bacterium]
MSENSPSIGSKVGRRDFLRTSAVAGTAAAAVASGVPLSLFAEDKTSAPESLVKVLYETLTPGQKEKICFGWDHKDDERGLLRTRVANNWNITDAELKSDFYTKDQLHLVRQIFEGIIHPDWHKRYDQQMADDCGGFGIEQSIAIFGTPGSKQFEFVLTGRHMTLRCDGNSSEHVAFGGPIFYGHAPDFDEEADHSGNVFWEQAIEANKVYQMLDEKQRKQAEVPTTPREQSVAFQGASGNFTGIPVSELSGDQKEGVQKVLKKLTEMYRTSDQDEVMACMKKQGGLDKCHLSFFTDNDIGEDKVWDNWRLEGPSFVWHYRGAPHVHVWVNVADDPSVKLNA